MPPEREPQRFEDGFEAAMGAGIADACLEAERATGLPVGVLLAISSRESGCHDIVSPDGHRRGALGIDDQRHREWLDRQGAGEEGARPSIDDAARYVAGLLVAKLAVARANGVLEADLTKFALSAYNAGVANALAGYQRGDSDLESDGGDYGADVLGRMAAAQAWLLARSASTSELPRLEPGSSNAAVIELKRRLRIWYRSQGRRLPRRMRGPAYGSGAVEAVKEFQQAHGIAADGIVGPETWQALNGLGGNGRHNEAA